MLPIDNYTTGDNKYLTTSQEKFNYLEKHIKSFVRTPTAPEGSSFSQRGGDTFDKKFCKNKECFNCGKKGHPSTHCTSKKKKDKDSDNGSQSSQTSQMDKMKKDLKKTKKSFATLQTQFEKLEEDDDASDITGSGDESGSSFLQVSKQCFAQGVVSELQKQLALHNKSDSDEKLQLRNLILLDNQSTMDLICNKKFTSNIKKFREKLRVHINSGTLVVNQQSEMPRYKINIWFSKKAITNIVLLKNVIKQYRVTYDSNDEQFIVYRQDSGLPKMMF